MKQRYEGVITRVLTRAERRIWTNEAETPLVLEPQVSCEMDFLRPFLARYSSEIIEDIARHGAVLFRGFAIETAAAFEQHILSIRGMVSMDEMLLSEPGRTRVEGTRHVFHTNTLMKTGGTLELGTIHTENYFIPDVPRYVAFWCETAPAQGGETALINTAQVYADLPRSLQLTLEEQASLVGLYPLKGMAHRYDLPETRLIEFCKEVGLTVLEIAEDAYLAVYKPNVLEHPLTHERALGVSLSWIPAVESELLRIFVLDYNGVQWWTHKLVWQVPALNQAIKRLGRRRFRSLGGAILTTGTVSPVAGSRTLAAAFTLDDLKPLAMSLRLRSSSFLWRRGDVLILDNLKIAHQGMPGRGQRELKVMLTNVLKLPTTADASGVCRIENAEAREPLGARLMRMRAPTH